MNDWILVEKWNSFYKEGTNFYVLIKYFPSKKRVFGKWHVQRINFNHQASKLFIATHFWDAIIKGEEWLKE